MPSQFREVDVAIYHTNAISTDWHSFDNSPRGAWKTHDYTLVIYNHIVRRFKRDIATLATSKNRTVFLNIARVPQNFVLEFPGAAGSLLPRNPRLPRGHGMQR
jgi:hypothetical protein